ncbi:hypothetical protein AX17_007525 [Amanita inopinata Kibby_2008]|nr:hypothetical protein AX17_007525 [Amanita inopinata Kibby_2008]
MNRSPVPFDAELKSLDYGFCNAHNYCHILQQFYATERIPKRRWVVTEVAMHRVQAKYDTFEYLIATVRDAAGHTKFLRIQRRFQRQKMASLFGMRSNDDNGTSSQRSSFPTFSELPPPCSPATKAVDCIMTIEKSDIDHKPNHTIKFYRDVFKDERVTLPRLVVLICSINAIAPKYRILTKNCYWFTHIVEEALKRLCPDHSRIDLLGAKSEREGIWRVLPENRFLGGDDVDEVLNEYRRQWKDFIREIEYRKNVALEAQDNTKYSAEAEEAEDLEGKDEDVQQGTPKKETKHIKIMSTENRGDRHSKARTACKIHIPNLFAAVY